MVIFLFLKMIAIAHGGEGKGAEQGAPLPSVISP